MDACISLSESVIQYSYCPTTNVGSAVITVRALEMITEVLKEDSSP